ncbi:ABC transporter permease [Amycolatopsis antarctica]|uniref:ABC transporter permease n=1 Tax=Amycolatopsis antarctica TaxID=1854586 RepID=A0A263D4L9_9PSEU|nr:ABC transporter permease [Amycolatopsis antarctica]OZM73311.1 ABC transporter permease [Amycolatopsis antarctica]
MSRNLIGTGALIRLALRRDRLVLPLWVLVLGVIPAATAGAYETLYPTAAERQSLGAGMGANPSTSLLYGAAFDLSTAGGFTAWRYGAFLALFAGLAAVFTVTRHTRAEEDTGRLELLASAVVGRFAALTAAVTVAAGGSLGVGVVATLGLAGAGLPIAGSIAFGLGTALAGWAFTGVAAIAAQLAEYSRTANGMGAGTLGALFLLRGVGDASTDLGWLSWASPLGWATQVRAFAGERWWVLALPVAAAVVLTAIGYALLARRDLGMGLVPARPGPATAAPGLRSPLALAWRLHRGPLLGWTAGFAVMGALFGTLASGIGGLVGDSERTIFERMGGAQSLVEAFISATAGILAMIASLYGVQATLRMRSEETAFRAEPLLATPVSRLRWAASHLTFSLLGTGLMVTVAGPGTGLAHGSRVGDVGGQLPGILAAWLAQLPAVWVVVGVTVAILGSVPRLATAAWVVAAAFLLISLFGPVAQVSQAVLDVSPFTHVPKLPVAEFSATPLLVLAGVAAAALLAGLAGLRRRDIG